MSSTHLKVSEKQNHDKDAIIAWNLSKLEAALQFTKRDYRSKNMGLTHHISLSHPQTTMLKVQHYQQNKMTYAYSLNSDFIT